MSSEVQDSGRDPRAGCRPARIIALIRDLFFSVKIRNELESSGHESVIVKREPELLSSVEALDPVLVLIDLATRPDWKALTPLQHSGENAIPILAFGPHKDVEARRAAQAAGVTRVLTNQQMHRGMLEFVERYRKTQEPA